MCDDSVFVISTACQYLVVFDVHIYVHAEPHSSVVVKEQLAVSVQPAVVKSLKSRKKRKIVRGMKSSLFFLSTICLTFVLYIAVEGIAF